MIKYNTIFSIAKEVNRKSSEVLEYLKRIGVEVTYVMSKVDDVAYKKVLGHFKTEIEEKARKGKESEDCKKRLEEEDRIKKEREHHLRKELDERKKLIEQKRLEREKQKLNVERRITIDERVRTQTIIILKKPDWKDFESILNANRINFLYHFTDKANIQSIINNGGLYSWDYSERNNITIPRPGGTDLSRQLDIIKGLQNYVRLCFVKEHPMLYVATKEGRIITPVLLKIGRDVIYGRNTKFSDINATTTRTRPNIGNTFTHLSNINFRIFNRNYKDLNENEKKQYQAEVLVEEKIPINYILNIHDFC
jgi:hypothetical protein